MTDVQRISEAEWRVMNVLWRKGPLTGNEVVEVLSTSTSWKPNTIKTLLTRLRKKRVLGYTKRGREYEYYPLLKRAACIREASRSFLKRVFGGALAPMLATFLENEDLSPEEIEELRQILERRRRT